MKTLLTTFSILVLFMSLMVCPQAWAQIQSSKEYDIYFLAGQSNAAGRGDGEELSSIEDGKYAEPQDDVLFYYHHTLKNRDGKINASLPADTFLKLQPGSGHGFNNPQKSPQ